MDFTLGGVELCIFSNLLLLITYWFFKLTSALAENSPTEH